MTETFTLECEVHFDRRGRGSRKVLETGPGPFRPAEPGRVPRVARLMALAIRFDGLLREGRSRATPNWPAWATSRGRG